MTTLPITRMSLYKHGVGYFVRRGPVEGSSLELTFRFEEMDDVLKSLTVVDHGVGRVQGIDYDTPQSQAEKLTGCSIDLHDKRSLRDLLVALRGRPVVLSVSDGSSVEGILLGLDESSEKPQKHSLVSVLNKSSELVTVLPLSKLDGLELSEQAAADDLRFFLKNAQSRESHRSLSIRLDQGEHDLEVSYIAPAPTWRVSYRLVVETPADGPAKVLLQGWGIFDNRLEEDLEDVSLSLTAGMPISFVYDLYKSHIPERPSVEDHDRVAAGPVEFVGAAYAEAAEAPPAAAAFRTRSRAEVTRGPSIEEAADSAYAAATGQEVGELFKYDVTAPVSVGRGQSAMVLILSERFEPDKDYIYNGSKQPTHPVASLRFQNASGLTLERGPVTVIENGEYVGEAVLPFTGDGVEAVVAYAVELGVHVKEQCHYSSELHSIAVKKGYLLQQHYDIRRTEYALDNRSSESKTVLIEHTPDPDFTAFDTPEPDETTLDTLRYAVDAAPRTITSFTVQERLLRRQRESLEDQSYRNLKSYLDGKFLDKNTHDALAAILGVRDEIAKLEQSVEDQAQDRKQLYKGQEQIQKSMAALSKDGEEGRLRGRYVKQLEQSEDRLAEIVKAIEETRQEIQRKKAQLDRMIGALV